MKQLFNTNFFSLVVKYAFGFAALLLSAILSYTFFQGIEPSGMAVFPFAALTLTEGGLLAWIAVFALMNHHQIKGLIAILMIAACFVTTIVVTFAELIQLFQDHSLVSNATVQNGTLILLEAMLGLHVLALVADFLIGKIEHLLHTWVPLKDAIKQQPPARATHTYPNGDEVSVYGPTQQIAQQHLKKEVQQYQQASTDVQQQTVPALSPEMQQWLELYRVSGESGTMSFPAFVERMHKATNGHKADDTAFPNGQTK